MRHNVFGIKWVEPEKKWEWKMNEDEKDEDEMNDEEKNQYLKSFLKRGC